MDTNQTNQHGSELALHRGQPKYDVSIVTGLDTKCEIAPFGHAHHRFERNRSVKSGEQDGGDQDTGQARNGVVAQQFEHRRIARLPRRGSMPGATSLGD